MMRHQRCATKPRWGDPYNYKTSEGADVTSQIEYVGYGFTHYTIAGTPDQIVAEGDRILKAFPSDPYGTQVYWPPDKWQHHNTPVEVSPGIWQAKAWRSNTSD